MAKREKDDYQTDSLPCIGERMATVKQCSYQCNRCFWFFLIERDCYRISVTILSLTVSLAACLNSGHVHRTALSLLQLFLLHPSYNLLAIFRSIALLVWSEIFWTLNLVRKPFTRKRNLRLPILIKHWAFSLPVNDQWFSFHLSKLSMSS